MQRKYLSYFLALLILCFQLQVAQAATYYTFEGDSGPCGEEDKDDGIWVLYLLAGAASLATASAPWWGPPSALQDDYDIAGNFVAFPYADGHEGFVVLESDFTGVEYQQTKKTFLRAMADYGTGFGDVERIGARIHIETTKRIGFDTEWASYTVDRRPSGGNRDYNLGDANVIFRFGQSKRASWWTGAGFNWVEEGGDVDYGYNLTYGADVCLGDPWILSGQFDWGEIQHDSFFRGRVTIGTTWHGIEAFTGFDYTDFRSHHDGTVVFGLRGWF